MSETAGLEAEGAVLWAGSPHPMHAVPTVVLGLALLGSGLVIAWLTVDGGELLLGLVLGVPSIAVGLLVVAIGVLDRQRTSYVLTTEEAVVERGVLRPETRRVSLSAVREVEVDRGPVGRALSIGSVDVFGGDDEELAFANVRHPERVAGLIVERIEAD